MEVLPSTRFRTANGSFIPPGALRPGDRVLVIARPQPERALTFTLTSLVDRDLVSRQTMSGVIALPDTQAHHLVLHSSTGADVPVDLQRRTRVIRAGRIVSTSQLVMGQHVTVAGSFNRRLDEMVWTDHIVIESPPSLKEILGRVLAP